VSKVFADGATACAITPAGKIKCWGSQALGTGVTDMYSNPIINDTPDTISPTEIFFNASSAYACACATDIDGLKCWGNCPAPGYITNDLSKLKSSKKIVGSVELGCAINGDNSLVCWQATNFADRWGQYDISKMPSYSGQTLLDLTDWTRGFCVTSAEKGVQCTPLLGWDGNAADDRRQSDSDWANQLHELNLVNHPTGLLVGFNSHCESSTQGLKCSVMTDSASLTQMPDLSLVAPKKVVMTGITTCMLDASDSLYCWQLSGSNADWYNQVYGSLSSAAPGTATACNLNNSAGKITINSGSNTLLVDQKSGGLSITKCFGDLQPDYSFGDYGTTLKALGSNTNIQTTLQSGGKILLAGAIGSVMSGEQRLLIARLNSDGTLDNTFNGIGYRIDNLATTPPSVVVEKINIAADGTITLTGKASRISANDYSPFSKNYSDGGTQL
jgi:hypothetical protein